jgi:hypothetical protein
MRYQFILLLVVAVVFLSSPAFSDAIVEVQPSLTTANPGDLFSINIDVSGVTGLYAFQFDVTFDPNILGFSEITEGSFLMGGGSTFFIPGINDPNGTLTFTADTLVGPVPGVTGDGTLATLFFQSLAPGSSPIDLSNVTLLDSYFGDISATTVNGAATVPEPGVLLLLTTSLGALWIGRHRFIR